MILTVENLTEINKEASDIYFKHVKYKSEIKTRNKTKKGVKLGVKEVSDMICLYIYGATHENISKEFNCKSVHVVYRKSYRGLAIPFQTSLKKSRGKMVFTYNKDLVEKHFKKLPKRLRMLCKPVIIEERLVLVSDILEQELWI